MISYRALSLAALAAAGILSAAGDARAAGAAPAPAPAFTANLNLLSQYRFRGIDQTYTIGGFGYWYPGASYANAACPSAAFGAPCSLPDRKLNTFELNAGVTWRWLSYKLSAANGDTRSLNRAVLVPQAGRSA